MPTTQIFFSIKLQRRGKIKAKENIREGERKKRFEASYMMTSELWFLTGL